MATPDEDDLSSFRDGPGRVQPRWVKALTLLVAFPAWAVLMTGIVSGGVGGGPMETAFRLLAAIAVLQLIFVVRAYWRMDL